MLDLDELLRNFDQEASKPRQATDYLALFDADVAAGFATPVTGDGLAPGDGAPAEATVAVEQFFAVADDADAIEAATMALASADQQVPGVTGPAHSLLPSRDGEEIVAAVTVIQRIMHAAKDGLPQRRHARVLLDVFARTADFHRPVHARR